MFILLITLVVIHKLGLILKKYISFLTDKTALKHHRTCHKGKIGIPHESNVFGEHSWDKAPQRLPSNSQHTLFGSPSYHSDWHRIGMLPWQPHWGKAEMGTFSHSLFKSSRIVWPKPKVKRHETSHAYTASATLNDYESPFHSVTVSHRYCTNTHERKRVSKVFNWQNKI